MGLPFWATRRKRDAMSTGMGGLVSEVVQEIVLWGDLIL